MAFDLSKLSPREREVYNFIRDGRSEKETAAALNITKRTVKFHRNGLYRKLGLAKTGGTCQVQIESYYRDTLKDCELNILLAIASFEQRLKALNV